VVRAVFFFDFYVELIGCLFLGHKTVANGNYYVGMNRR
jgi:hypothetical protein